MAISLDAAAQVMRDHADLGPRDLIDAQIALLDDIPEGAFEGHLRSAGVVAMPRSSSRSQFSTGRTSS